MISLCACKVLPALANPLGTRATAEARIKTDKVDAGIAVRLLAAEFTRALWAPGPEQGQLRILLGYRARLVRLRTALDNRHDHASGDGRYLAVPLPQQAGGSRRGSIPPGKHITQDTSPRQACTNALRWILAEGAHRAVKVPDPRQFYLHLKANEGAKVAI